MPQVQKNNTAQNYNAERSCLQIVNSRPGNRYRPDIDGLRGVAVVVVLLFHFFPESFSFGFMGVDIFFVISGFLISGILFRQIENSSFSLQDFYVRRAKRIFPALITVLVFCVGIGFWVLYSPEYRRLAKHLAGAASFLTNLFLVNETGYFENSAESKPLLHLWSLAIEEQFYLIWPLLLVTFWRRARSILAFLVGFSCLSFIWCLWSSYRFPTSSFYLPFSRLWELSLGGTLAYLSTKKFSSLDPRRANLFASLGLGILVLGASVWSQDTPFPGWIALAPTLGTAFIILFEESWLNKRFLSQPALVGVGKISYPLYLWHWPLLYFARTVCGGPLTLLTSISLIGFSLLFAWITFQCIETPVRYGIYGSKPSVLFLLLGAVGITGIVIYTQNGFPQRSVNQATYGDLSLLENIHFFPEAEACLHSRFGSDLKIAQKCAEPLANPKVLLLGDSHAGSLYHGLASVGVPSTVIWNPGCPPIGTVELKMNCKAHWAELEGLAIKYRKQYKVVLLTYYGTTYFNENLANGEIAPQFERWIKEAGIKTKEELKLEFRKGLFATIQTFQKYGMKVGLIQDVPDFSTSGPTCIGVRPLSWLIPFQDKEANKCETPIDAVLRRHRLAREIDREAHEKLGVPLFDGLGAICSGQKCSIVLDGKLAYADSHHLNKHGSQYLAKKLNTWLQNNFPMDFQEPAR